LNNVLKSHPTVKKMKKLLDWMEITEETEKWNWGWKKKTKVKRRESNRAKSAFLFKMNTEELNKKTQQYQQSSGKTLAS